MDEFEEKTKEIADVLDRYIKELDDPEIEITEKDMRRCMGDIIYSMKEIIGWITELRRKFLKATGKMNVLFEEEEEKKIDKNTEAYYT